MQTLLCEDFVALLSGEVPQKAKSKKPPQPQGTKKKDDSNESADSSIIVKKKAISFKDHIVGSMLLIMTSGNISLIRDCLQSIK